MAFTFFGGIHPAGNKHYAKDCPITVFPEPDTVVIPMAQHIGAPCKPLVKKGDRVLLGQKIGEVQGLGAPIHASVSGTVTAVTPKAHTGGTMVLSVVIENDHLNEIHPDVVPRTNIDDLTPEDLMKIIREAGIVGMGGATFPTHVKLSSALGKVDTIIVNASECEPYITADDILLREQGERVIMGLGIIMKILNQKEAHIAMEDNKPQAAAAVRELLPRYPGIILDVLPTKYPQGAEKQLIYAVTGRQVPSGGLPAAVGCAVFNAATCAAIYDAVYDGLPLVRRLVTVSGDILMKPANYLVPIGTSFNDLLEACGHCEPPYKVLSGGPMMGVAQFDLAVPIIKGSNAVTVLGKKNQFAVKTPHCIRCGKCVEVCPMRLMPLFMYKAERSSNLEDMKKFNVMDCIECGCCAYTCPATIPLVQSFRTGKQKLRDAQPPKPAPKPEAEKAPAKP